MTLAPIQPRAERGRPPGAAALPARPGADRAGGVTPVRSRRVWSWVTFFFLLWTGAVFSFEQVRAGVAEITRAEPEVKAAYIYKIGLFTEWPTNKFPKADAPMVIGILGRSDVARELEVIARTNKIANRKIVIRRLTLNSDFTEPHIVFVGQDQKFEPVLAKLKPIRGALTIGEHADFMESGGMVNFVLDQGTVKFQVNPGAVTGAELEISSRLLDVVRGWKMIFKSNPPKGGR